MDMKDPKATPSIPYPRIIKILEIVRLKTIIKIFENVPRMTEKKVTAGDGVSFVLEINSGVVEEFEIDASWILNFSDFFETKEPFC